jgi:pilus assembly protein CpaF
MNPDPTLSPLRARLLRASQQRAANELPSALDAVVRDADALEAPDAAPRGVPASTAAEPEELAPRDPIRVTRRPASPDVMDAVKQRVHRKVVERLDPAALTTLADETLASEAVREVIAAVLQGESATFTLDVREQLVEELLHEILGYGPIEPLLKDPTISDILVNGPRDVYVERSGKLQLTDVRFRDNDHIMAVIDRIVSRIGRRVDESSPMVDGRLPDGSRVNAIIPPVALDAPILSIRRFGKALGADRLVQLGALSPEMLLILRGCVRAKLNLLVSGGTGSGKTTLLNALSSYIPDGERVVTIEDAAELQLQQPHVVRLETRPPNSEERGEVSMRALLRNALRMRPDRIVIGEVRGAEAMDMLQAMNTGHEGSLTTLHANTPRDALMRLETMVRYGAANLPDRSIREQVASAIDVIVQTNRLSDGTRRVTSITEVTGLEGDALQTQEIFRFHKLGIDEHDRVSGRFEALGVRPRFADRLAQAGMLLPQSLFAEHL